MSEGVESAMVMTVMVRLTVMLEVDLMTPPFPQCTAEHRQAHQLEAQRQPNAKEITEEGRVDDWTRRREHLSRGGSDC